MIHKLLVGITLAAALTSATPNTNLDQAFKTYYTPNGGKVYITSTDASTHDDDIIIGCDEAAEVYITFESNSDFYTLYSLEADGIHEIWMTGRNTTTIADDFAADWQTWDFPTIHNTIQY